MDTLPLLEKAYKRFHQSYRRSEDAIFHVYRFSSNEDREVVAFISSLLAFGKVKMIQKSVHTILEGFGDSPHQALMTRKYVVKPVRHRWVNEQDMAVIFYWLHKVLNKSGSLEKFVCESQESSIKGILTDFSKRFVAEPLPRDLEKIATVRQRSLKYLVPSPAGGSACKRMNMFLRWMVRPNDGIDLGLWTQLNPKDLMLPLDTHLFKTVKALGWTQSKTANWKTVEQATAKLREIDPLDPIRFDFSLCQLSMSGGTLS